MKKNILYSIGILLLAISLQWISCVKYKENLPLSNPAYLRVFNSITYQLNPFTKDLPSPFLVFLLDPEMDASGIPTSAKFVGDFLDQRELYSNSYAAKAADAGNFSNKDFPGTNPVLTAPNINGFDLSAWAQIPSGLHHIKILGRPRSERGFFQLNASEKKSVLVDTSINFSEGEVYTAEAINFDEAAKKSGLYVRKEDFIHQKFSIGQNYFSIFNLSANHPQPQANQIYPFIDSLNFYVSQYTSTCGNTSQSQPNFVCNFNPVQTLHDIYFRTVIGNFASTAQYDSIPNLDSSEYLFPDGTFKDFRYRPIVVMEFHQIASNPLSLYRPGYIFFSDDYYNPVQSLKNQYLGDLQFLIPGTGTFFQLLPNLGLTASNNNRIQAQSTVNIIELVNDRVFIMQMNRTF
jgi:hypothetical protein